MPLRSRKWSELRRITLCSTTSRVGTKSYPMLFYPMFRSKFGKGVQYKKRINVVVVVVVVVAFRHTVS